MFICDYICSICAFISNNFVFSLCLFSCELTCDAVVQFFTEVFDNLSTEVSQIGTQLNEVFASDTVEDVVVADTAEDTI